MTMHYRQPLPLNQPTNKLARCQYEYLAVEVTRLISTAVITKPHYLYCDYIGGAPTTNSSDHGHRLRDSVKSSHDQTAELHHGELASRQRTSQNIRWYLSQRRHIYTQPAQPLDQPLNNITHHHGHHFLRQILRSETPFVKFCGTISISGRYRSLHGVWHRKW